MKAKILHNGTLLALSAAFISGVSIFINKFAVTNIADPVLFSGVKNTLVAILLIGIIFSFKKRKEVKELTKKQWGTLGLIGLIGGAIPFALFFAGLSMVPAISGALIHKTLFIWVALLGVIFLSERFSLPQWIGVGALFGANLVLGGFEGFTGSVGELLILCATLLWAGEIILAKKILSELSSLTVASGRMVFGSLFLFGFLFITGRLSGLGEVTLISLGWTLLTAIFLLGYVLTWYRALKYAPASYATALLVPATLITNVLSAVYITGALTETQVLSSVLLTLGTVFIIYFAKDSMKATPREEKNYNQVKIVYGRSTSL